jgi:hypothetical protein
MLLQRQSMLRPLYRSQSPRLRRTKRMRQAPRPRRNRRPHPDASSCRRPVHDLCTLPRRSPYRSVRPPPERPHPLEVSNVAARSLTAVPQARQRRASVHKATRPQGPARAVPCIPRAASPEAARRQARDPALASVPERAHVPASARDPAPERPGLCHLPVRPCAHSAPRRAHGVAASSTQRPRKAR